LGLGTWKSPKDKAGMAVEHAIRCGYRHIDTAPIYENLEEIGDAIQRVIASGLVKREDLFITSKLWNTDWIDPRRGLQKTLHQLKLDYLDLFLVHTAVPFEYSEDNYWPKDEHGYAKVSNVPLHHCWSTMEKLKEEGTTKSIGISNFPVVLIRDLLSYANIPPAIHQIEIHPYFTQEENATFCRTKGIQITAYSPLASAKEGPLKDTAVLQLSHLHRVSAAQILIRWCIDKGYSVIPKSANPARIKKNMEVMGFKLSDEEVMRLSRLNRNLKTCDVAKIWPWPYYYA